MTAKPPPVPPANQNPNAPRGGDATPVDTTRHGRPDTDKSDPNADKTGQAGNTAINTTHQGHQQDR